MDSLTEEFNRQAGSFLFLLLLLLILDSDERREKRRRKRNLRLTREFNEKALKQSVRRERLQAVARALPRPCPPR